MNTDVAYEKGGKKYNKWDEEIIPCGLCGRPTVMGGTKRCARCWELETRIRGDVDLARKILADIDAKKEQKADG